MPFRMTPLTMEVEAAGVTSVGRAVVDRGRGSKENDDRLIVVAERRLFVVADASGPTYGDYHAPLGVDPGLEAFVRTFGAAPGRDGEARLRAAFVAANGVMHARHVAYEVAFQDALRVYGEDRLGAAAAAAQAILDKRFDRHAGALAHFTASATAAHVWPPDKLTVAHVGSGRSYQLRQGRIDLLVPDPTRASTGASEVSERELPESGVPRLLGAAEAVDVAMRTVSVEPGDLYLLCTDGLWNCLSEAEILAAASAEGPEDELGPSAATIVDALVALAAARSRDNVTALVILIR